MKNLSDLRNRLEKIKKSSGLSAGSSVRSVDELKRGYRIIGEGKLRFATSDEITKINMFLSKKENGSMLKGLRDDIGR